MVRRRSSGTWRTVARGAVAFLTVGFACLSYSWVTLPDVRVLRNQVPGQTAFMAIREQEARREGRAYRERHEWVPYSRIAQTLKRAVIVTEDAAFWDHDGIDYHELRASFELSLNDGGPMRGASTLTQQLAKNLYLSPSRNPYRKLVELMITRRLEAELTKTRIFELYLNLVEWGDGIWGAEAAARHYFGRSAAELSPSQAALLAGALINPRVYSPAQPNARLRARQRLVLARMGTVEPPPPASAPPMPAIVDDLPSAATPLTLPPPPADAARGDAQ